MTPSYFVIVAFLSLSLSSTPRDALAGETAEPASLWYSAPTTDQSSAQRRPWVLRERDIILDVQLLQVHTDATARPHPRMTVEFFDATRHELDVTSTVSRFNDTAVLRGSFKPPSRGD